jgi:hypothetical protein
MASAILFTFHSDYSPRIVAGDNAKVSKLLAKLDALGISRVLPAWEHGEPPAYPRGIGSTTLRKPVWTYSVDEKHKKKASELKRQATTALSAVQKASDALFSELKANYRAIANYSTIRSLSPRPRPWESPQQARPGKVYRTTCPSCSLPIVTLNHGYANEIRHGRVPHPRHWQALVKLSGASK